MDTIHLTHRPDNENKHLFTTTHFYVLGQTWSGNPSPTFHTHPLNFYDAVMVVVNQNLSRMVLYPPGLEPVACGVWIL